MLSIIFGFITGLAGPISAVINNITDLKKVKAKAESDKEIKEINLQIEEAHDKKAILLAMVGNRILTAVYAFILIGVSVPVLAILNKIGYDKTIGSLYGCDGDIPLKMREFCRINFHTDSIDPNMWWVIFAVVSLVTLHATFRNKV